MQIKLELIHLKRAQDAMIKDLIKQTNQIIKSSVEEIKDEVKRTTKELMQNSRFFNELLFGTLSGHFGIPSDQVSGNVIKIINEISNNVEIIHTNLSTLNKNVRGGLKIGIGKNGFATLLNMSEGRVTTKDGQLPWLDWVLTKGDQIIVSEHDIQFEVGAGRSGLAIMVPDKIASWRVPAEFSGTIEDNVITRQILRNLEIYSRNIARIFNKQIRSKILK